MAKGKLAAGKSDRSASAATSGAVQASPSFSNNTVAAAPKPAVRMPPTHDQIAKRAFEIWVAKGRPVGKDVENWQQAERELRAK